MPLSCTTWRRQPASLFAPPDSVFDFVYVDDIVSALLLASGEDWDEAPANVSGGRGVRLRDLHAAFTQIFGYGVPLVDVEREPSTEVPSNERALGWEPRWSLEEGLAETLRYFAPGLAVPGDLRIPLWEGMI